MQNAVVFFSRDGNTRAAADMFELEEAKKRDRSAFYA
jgi:hypothetical protein